jgi:transcriptional regulator with XRE-family HTH domain
MLDTIPEIIAFNVRRLREAQGWTQADVAERLSQIIGKAIDLNYISMLETGKRRMRYPRLADLCKALQADQKELIFVPDYANDSSYTRLIMRLFTSLDDADAELLGKVLDILVNQDSLGEAAVDILKSTIDSLHDRLSPGLTK